PWWHCHHSLFFNQHCGIPASLRQNTSAATTDYFLYRGGTATIGYFLINTAESQRHCNKTHQLQQLIIFYTVVALPP
ncbi:hypothetical protein, partial [Escherichia coli]|uniref:hypothetical protein n=1 Tax=Escherichia coli TaxID=562 RepID=UPI00193B2FDB